MSRRLPRTPFALLAAMTIFTTTGPIGIWAILKGGARPDWPPDRAVEWAVVLGVSAMVVSLMMACCSLVLVNRKAVARATDGTGGPSEDRP
ncbi:hypothetical protein P12x_004731 [Tundrisphaera lichenicola]|uniref:hypothetical protein n=1 Tax=Tundrisphaera lichenicola TaxID=2029860 RepID=UPI003EBCD538